MGDVIFTETVNQFKTLIRNRGLIVNDYSFTYISDNSINIYNNKVLKAVVQLTKFNIPEILRGSQRWSEYKTMILNNSVNTAFNVNALVATTNCIDWERVWPGNVGGVGLNEDIDQYLGNAILWDGVTVTATLDGNQGTDSGGNLLKLMIFNSTFPTGGDPDLLTPINPTSNVFGGIDRIKAHGNILIVSEDNDITDPDDKAANRGKSKVTFNFSEPVNLLSLEFIDSDEPGGVANAHNISIYGGPDGSGVHLGRAYLAEIGDNGAQLLPIDVANVRSFVFEFTGSGAISDICFRKQNEVASTRVINSNNEVDKCFVYPNNENYTGWTSGLVKSVIFDKTYNIYASATQCDDISTPIGTAHVYFRGVNTANGFFFVDLVISDPTYTLVDSNISISPSIVATDSVFNYTYGSGMGSYEFDVIGESTDTEHFYDINYSSISDNFFLIIQATVRNNSIGKSNL